LLQSSGRPTTLVTPADGRSMATIDGSPRIIERINTVDYLELFAKRILPKHMHDAFTASRKDGFGTYFVQAPVGALSEAVMHVKYLGKGKCDALMSKRKAILPAYVTPLEFLRHKKQKGVDHDHLSFVDAITAGSVSSPSRTDQIVTTEHKPSPLHQCFDEEVHRNIIKARFVDRDTSNNFRGAISMLRNMRDYQGRLLYRRCMQSCSIKYTSQSACA
jgi:hypothetical protein